MVVESASCDPVIHAAAVRISRRCVGIIEPLLRQEEKPEAAREFYLVARDELERMRERRKSG
jgi:hypothetical protein